MPTVAHGSWTFVWPRSLPTRIPNSALRMSTSEASSGLRQNSWRKGQSARRQIYSLSRWSRSRCVTDDLLLVERWQTIVPQVFTGTTPFGDMQPILVVVAITQGRRPQRPAHPWFTGKLWRVINRCWKDKPQLRPEAAEVLQALCDSLVSHSFQRSYAP